MEGVTSLSARARESLLATSTEINKPLFDLPGEVNVQVEMLAHH